MGKGSTGNLETPTLIPVKFIPKYRPRYRPVYGPRYQPNLRRVFQPRWEALIQRRRLQRHAYTPEELEERRPGLVERWRERHEKWAEEAKVHEKAMKVQPRYMSYALIPRYRPAYRSVYRPMYSPKQRPKPKYTCAECRTSYLWLNDFLAHIKSDHRGKRPLRLPPGLSRLGKEEP